MNALVWACYAIFAARRLLTYLHIFQQEEYDGLRFLKWMGRRRVFDRRATGLLVLLGTAEFVVLVPPLLSLAILCVIFLALALVEANPLRSAKKKLVMTGRAKRIFAAALLFSGLMGAGAALLGGNAWLWIIPTQAIPLALVLGNVCLMPYDTKERARFWNEAYSRLLSLKPLVIGITGSYGKTSVKHILGHVLGSQGSVLITPGSINTPMGIARVIRERLGSHHRFFVCEMGAYGHGSIARLCKLSPPAVGVITAIGLAHYERFGTLEAVVETKFELAESVVSRGGKVVVAEDVLGFKYAQAFIRTHPDAAVVVGTGSSAALQMVESHQSLEGLAVRVRWLGKEYTVKARLFGEHHARNLSLVFATCCVLGMPPEDVVVAMRSVPQIAHRSEVKQEGSGPIVIDDAYNSNPLGFANGLRLLKTLRTNDGRRILVTPGMVELGAKHDEEHRRIGRLAADQVDVLLPVLPNRISALVEGYRKMRTDGCVVPCATFAEAQRWLEANLRQGDVVLLENDLPDLYEKRIRL